MVSTDSSPTAGTLCHARRLQFPQSIPRLPLVQRARVSARIIPHRSPGEKDLADLAGKPVFKPSEKAFLPKAEAFAWRCERLVG